MWSSEWRAGRNDLRCGRVFHGAVPEVFETVSGQFDWRDIALPLTPELDAEDAFAAVLAENGSSRRDTLVRVRASGRARLPRRMNLVWAAENVAPEFGYFEFSDADLVTEYVPEYLDDIATGGALRMASEDLRGNAENASMCERDCAVAAAALRRLYGYVTREVQ